MNKSKKIIASAAVCAVLCTGGAITAFALQPAENSASEGIGKASQDQAKKESIVTEAEIASPVKEEVSASVKEESFDSELVPVKSKEYDADNKYTVITYEDGTKAYLADSTVPEAPVEPTVPGTTEGATAAEKYGNKECNIEGHFVHIYSNGEGALLSNDVKDDSEFKQLGSDTPFKDEVCYYVLEFLDGTKRYFREYPKELFAVGERDYGMLSYVEGGTGQLYREVVDGGVVEYWR